jgi:opacity protein-like surface antigen
VAALTFHLDLYFDVPELNMNRVSCATWSVTVVIVFTMVAASEFVAFGQLAPQKDPRASERTMTNPETSEAQKGVESQQIILQPAEGYFAAFGGYTFSGKLSTDGTGTFNGVSFGNGSLADSAVFGAKAGGFFPDSLHWFGVEAELFSTTPHIEQQGAAVGSHMRVTTLAINAIARAQFACEKKHLNTVQETERFAYEYVTEFCRLQPFAGVGLGINWVDISNSTFSAHDNFVPGLNALAGVRYYFTNHIAMFTEYKYNRVGFGFTGVQGLANFNGVYSINHIVGGISFHY